MRWVTFVGALSCLLGLGALAAEVSPEQIDALWGKPLRPRIAVAPTERPPTIDGKIEELEWRAASKVGQFIGSDAARWKGVPGYDYVSAQTTVFVTHDRENLYVAFRCDEPEIETLKLEGTVMKRDAPIWNDDCVELFLAPPGAGFHYHFIVNWKSWVYDAKEAGKTDSGREWDLDGLKVATSVSPPGKDSHWAVEMALPFAGFGVPGPKPGEVWGINFARERWAALYKAVIEYSTWSGLVGPFQNPQRFGEIRFGDIRQDIRLPRPFLGPLEAAAELTSGREQKLNLAVKTANSSRVTDAGSGTATLRPNTPTTSTVDAKIMTEGVQFLALLVSDPGTGDVVSCARVPFYVPDVLAAGERATARLMALYTKAERGSEFARSIRDQVGEVEAVNREAVWRRGKFTGFAPDEADRKAWQALRDRVGKIESATALAVWTNSPYLATGPSTMPPKLGPPPTLVIQAAQNETEHVVLNVTNLTDTAVECLVEGKLPGQVGRPRSGLAVSPQQLARNQPRLLGKELTDLPEKDDGLAMPLVELDGLNSFHVEPFSTRQIWFTVQTRDLKAGKTRHSLRVVPLSLPLPPVDVAAEMTVWDFRLADEAPIGVFCFDYAGDYEWMKSYKINLWFRGAFPYLQKDSLNPDGTLKPYETDISRVKQRMKEGARKFLLSYGYTGSFIEWAQKSKIEYMSDPWKRLFKDVLARMVKELLDAGLRYEDFALQTIDEAHGVQVQQVLETTPLIREVDPKVRLAMTIMTGLDDLKKMAPCVDVWVNRNGAMWGKDEWDFFHAEQAKGKAIYSWNMPCNPKSQPLTQFRTYGWRAMKFDFDAIGFFLYFGLVYDPMRPGGGIATRHWEAWRDGVEDYQVLWTLRDELRKARERGVPKEGIEASEKLLAKTLDDVITDKFFPPNMQETADRIQAARALVAAEILRVRGMR